MWFRNSKREECFYEHSSRNGNSRRLVEHIQMVFLFKKLRFIADNKISSESFPYFGRRHLRGKQTRHTQYVTFEFLSGNAYKL